MTKLILLGLLISLVNSDVKPENNAPEVVITEPSQSQGFSWNTTIRYNIRIDDKEDGKSEYDEINANEVILEAAYLPDDASAKTFVANKKHGKENRGLTTIRTSDCFNCHASKSKLIGPSFEMIAQKYKKDESSIERLKNHIINGSTGAWGTASMPAHKALDPNDATAIVHWIFKTGAAPDLAFYPGIQGAFKTEKKPGAQVLVLTASYRDHGDNNSSDNTMYGQHSIYLKAIN